MIVLAKKKKVVKRNRLSSKIRVFISLITFGIILSLLGYNCYQNVYQVAKLNNRKKELKKELVVLDEKGEALESDIKRLKDPDYIAKYVREKYLYSKNGELIIRIKEDE